MSARRCLATLACTLAALLLGRSLAYAIELRAEPSILGQVRDGNGVLPGETEVPVEFYGDFGLSRLPHGATLDTYFRLEEDFSRLDGETDFFSGVLRVPSAPLGLDLQLGRQIIAESPVGMWDADSGQIRMGLGKSPFALTVFGGQPRYWEPTFGAPSLSQNEQIFGGSIRLLQQQGSALALGYLQQIRQGKELMQQITLTGARSFASLPGLPSLYGNFAFDADRANIDQVRAGVQSFLWQPKLLMNFESGYYKPQDNGDVVIQNINRREDPIFQLFSVSGLLQFRGGVRYNLTRTVSTFGDLSYQRYEQLQGSFINGYVWSGGLLYLPGGDGLEMVQLQYYGIDSGGGSVNGGRASYENRVYEDILFRVMCDVGYYDKATNQSGVAIASRIGVGYMFLPGLVGEVNFEANRNQFFPEDFRFGFFITYGGGYRADGDGVRRDTVGNQGRPWPWGPTRFGPTSWGVTPATWSARSSLPASGWAQQAFAAAALREAEASSKAGGADGSEGASGQEAMPADGDTR